MCELNVCVSEYDCTHRGGWLWFQHNVHLSCTASHETTHKPTQMKETILNAASMPLRLVIQNIFLFDFYGTFCRVQQNAQTLTDCLFLLTTQRGEVRRVDKRDGEEGSGDWVDKSIKQEDGGDTARHSVVRLKLN